MAIDAPDLTSDDVWRALKLRSIPEPVEPRAMGPVMLAAVREGWLEQTDRTRISPDPATQNHSRPQRIFRSAVLGRDAAVPAAKMRGRTVSREAPARPLVEQPRVDPLRPGATPVVRGPDCPAKKCSLTLLEVSSISPGFATGRCPKHGRQTVRL